MSKLGILSTQKSAVTAGLDKCMSEYKVAALTQKPDKRKAYDFVGNSSEIIFNFEPTVLSAKKFFFPQEEVILEYTPEGKVEAKNEAEPMVLFGVRPCEINAIKIMDEAFSESNGDPNYMAKREKSVVIGLDCQTMCDEKAFCSKVNAQNVTAGCDLLLHVNGDDILVSIYTEKGKTFADKYLTASGASEADLNSFNTKKNENFAAQKPFKGLDQLPEMFSKSKENKVWKEQGEKCLSCGSCIMVCPTCYCFDVVDEFALSLKTGERLRRWDACMLSPFAEVAGGENFREEAKERLHHRISRKFNYLMKKHGQSVCVGCGRCVRACLADINPKTFVEAVNGEG